MAAARPEHCAVDATAEPGGSADASTQPRPSGDDAVAGCRSAAGALPHPPKSQSRSCCGVRRRFEQRRAVNGPDQRQRGGQRRRRPHRRRSTPGERAREAHRGGPRDATARADRRSGKPKFNRDRYKGPAKPQGEAAAGSRASREARRTPDATSTRGKAERSQKPDFQSKPREERPVQVDPHSPFAKLAALARPAQEVGPMAEGRQRIDKWLFFARVVKSRSLAAKLASAGRVRINRDKATQAADQVKPGDVLTITLDRRILDLSGARSRASRRGPAEEARMLYEDLSPPPAPKDEAPSPTPSPPLREAGSGRPTKKERRETDRLRDGD